MNPDTVADRRRQVLASRLQVVERAEAYVRAHIERPVSVAGLCRMLGVSERGLRNAFRGVRGMGPKRRMLALRLEDVHRNLSQADDELATVTRIATGHGFLELGRFAGAYRQAFGESPSVTLSHGRRRPPGRGATVRERTR